MSATYGYIVLRDPATASNGWVNQIKVIHDTEEAARAQAASLCRKHGGRFIVYRGIAAAVLEPPPVPPIVWEWEASA